MDPVKRRGMGWIPDYPDFRDYTERTEEIHSVLNPKGTLKPKAMPISIDLREWCSPVEDQGAWAHLPARREALHPGIFEQPERLRLLQQLLEHKHFLNHSDIMRPRNLGLGSGRIKVIGRRRSMNESFQ